MLTWILIGYSSNRKGRAIAIAKVSLTVPVASEDGLLVQSRERATLDHKFWNGKRLAVDVNYLLQKILLGLKMVGQKKIKVLLSKGSLTRFRHCQFVLLNKYWILILGTTVRSFLILEMRTCMGKNCINFVFSAQNCSESEGWCLEEEKKRSKH